MAEINDLSLTAFFSSHSAAAPIDPPKPRPRPQAQPLPQTTPVDTPPLPASFSDVGLSSRVVSSLSKRLSIVSPTSVQCSSIPVLLSGRDVLMQSETGSGKTLAYFLPLLEDLLTLSLELGGSLDRSHGCLALIMVPTRELAAQITSVAARICLDYPYLVVGSLMGGEKKKSEKARLRKGVSVLVATPGRLVDHLQNTRAVNLTNLRWLVMDECDRLLDLGFEADIRTIVTECRQRSSAKRIRSVLVSATLDGGIERVAQFALQNPKLIKSTRKRASSEGESSSSASEFPVQLRHAALEVDSPHRLVALLALIRQRALNAQAAGKSCKVIVFFSTCASVEFHAAIAQAVQWPPGSSDAASLLPVSLLKLHGSLSQSDRMANFHQFSRCSSGVLFCTDVAARGLDLPFVELIVQFDPPEDLNDYAHRAGRSARMGANGESVIFLTPAEAEYLKAIEDKFHFSQFEALVLPKILSALKIGCRNEIEALGQPAGALLQHEVERLASESTALHQQAVSAYQSFIRAYAAYPKALKSIFHPRKLHFGHVARAFALKEEPGKIKKVKVQMQKRKYDQQNSETEMQNKKRKSVRAIVSEEFAA